MSGQSRPVQWLDQVAVATVPVEIDISNADKVRDDLLLVVKQGPAAMIVDMSRTTFCDSAGVNALVRVYQQALAAGAPLRLVLAAPAVQRVLSITGVDRLIGTFPTVSAALADQDVATARREAAREEAAGARSAAQHDPLPQPGPGEPGGQSPLGTEPSVPEHSPLD